MKRFKIFFQIYLLLLMTLLLSCVVFSFLFASRTFNQTINTGSVNIAVEDITLENNYSLNGRNNDYTSEDILEAYIGLNTITVVNFKIKNIGNSQIKYDLFIALSFSSLLLEFGKVLIYPPEISNEEIYGQLENEHFDNALIGSNITQLIPISTSEGIKSGIKGQIKSEFLEVSSLNEAYHEYQLKIVFMENLEITDLIEEVNGLKIELIISVEADVKGITTNWFTVKEKYLKFNCVDETIRPVIEEIISERVYYIDEAKSINLANFVTATDIIDGDISDKIVITSSPSFDNNKSGEYQVTFNVKNNKNINAIPFHLKITIWEFKKITSGDYHSLALSTHGFVYAWGNNQYGQLGDGTNNNSAIPKLIESLSDIVDIACGYGSSYAINKAGNIYAWGKNENGRLGDGTTISRALPVKCLTPAGITFTKISARFNNAGAITSTGDVYTWGYASAGATGGINDAENHIPTKIGISNIEHLEMGWFNGAAITKDKNLYTWGDDYYGQLGMGKTNDWLNPPSLVQYFIDEQIKIKDVSVGQYHMLAVSTTGKAYSWGLGSSGRLGSNDTADIYSPFLLPLPGTASKVVAGYAHNIVLMSDGRAYLFGENQYGKLGSGNTDLELSPVLLSSLSDIKDISLGRHSTHMLTNNSEVYSIGHGWAGVLGNGGFSYSMTPVKWVLFYNGSQIKKRKK